MASETFLADTFRDLANDPYWPQSEWKFSTLNMARLALMVVDCKVGARCLREQGPEQYWEVSRWLNAILAEDNISPSHYANVKKRVEESKE